MKDRAQQDSQFIGVWLQLPMATFLRQRWHAAPPVRFASCRGVFLSGRTEITATDGLFLFSQDQPAHKEQDFKKVLLRRVRTSTQTRSTAH